MVFQSCALFPHMTIFENMVFGLTLDKRPKIKINERFLEAAKISQNLGIIATQAENSYLENKSKGMFFNACSEPF